MPKSVTRLHTHGLALALGVLTGPDGTTEAGHLWEPVLRGPSPGTGTPSQAVVSLAPELPPGANLQECLVSGCLFLAEGSAAIQSPTAGLKLAEACQCLSEVPRHEYTRKRLGKGGTTIHFLAE